MVTMNTNKKGFKEGGNERDRRSEAGKTQEKDTVADKFHAL